MRRAHPTPLREQVSSRSAGPAARRWVLPLALLTAAASACGVVVPPLGGDVEPIDAAGDVDARSPVDDPADARGADVDGSVEPAGCPPGHARAAGTCVNVVASLHGRRIEVPCRAHIAPPHCRPALPPPWTGEVGGREGAIYTVALHVRGVVELAPYEGGVKQGHFYAGGKPERKDFNRFHMRVAGAGGGMHYYFNDGAPDLEHAVPLEYEVVIELAAGDQLLVEPADDDDTMLSNMDERGAPIVVSGVSPAPRPFDGQFIQLDVVSVEPSAEP